MTKTTLIIGSDHRGLELKQGLLESFKDLNPIVDVGCFSQEKVHYPQIVQEVVSKIRKGDAQMGILICGSGIGVSIAANRFKNIRAALCYNEKMGEMAKKHNDANILALGADMLEIEEALKIVRAWLNSTFENGRHTERNEMIDKICGETL